MIQKENIFFRKMSIVTEYAALNGPQNTGCQQWRSKNAEKITHNKGSLLDQAVILFNRVPAFQNWKFSYRKEFASRMSEFFHLRAVPYAMENHIR